MKTEKRGMLIAFSVRSGKFASVSERNKFFKQLYGWKQIIRKEVQTKGKKPKVSQQEKFYTYHREGVLDYIPHKKVDQSSFLIPENDFDRVEKFFNEWHKKVMWQTFRVLLDNDMQNFFERAQRGFEDEEGGEGEEDENEEEGEEGEVVEEV
jgi:hypothetical protein